jgi:hypothetical protein
METMKNNCSGMSEKLADLLLDTAAAPAKVQTHVAECESCRKELAALEATMALLDEWKAPEPNPYFVTRLNARMREERETAPAGWLARKMAGLRAGFRYGAVAHTRPLAAMALTVMLLVGGGTYLGVSDWNQPNQPAQPQTAVVHDLQLLDSNSQILDQLESMSSTQPDGD